MVTKLPSLALFHILLASTKSMLSVTVNTPKSASENSSKFFFALKVFFSALSKAQLFFWSPVGPTEVIYFTRKSSISILRTIFQVLCCASNIVMYWKADHPQQECWPDPNILSYWFKLLVFPVGCLIPSPLSKSFNSSWNQTFPDKLYIYGWLLLWQWAMSVYLLLSNSTFWIWSIKWISQFCPSTSFWAVSLMHYNDIS